MPQFLTPSVGTIFWMLVIFGIMFWILKKYAWKPILHALKQREYSIDKALTAADNARKEIDILRANQDEIIAQARQEKDQILKEAREMKDKMLLEAKAQAHTEAEKMIKVAQAEIQSQQKAAVAEMKKEIAELSVLVASKVIGKELESSAKQEAFVNDLIEDLKLN
ncbi:MAG: F0F1 ATP synthase subunit B [Mangrovibacterium sp.]